MRMPIGTETLATLLYLSRYAIARSNADPATSPLAELLSAPDATFRKAVGVRNQALDARTDALAVRDFALDGLNDLIADLARRAYAHFGNRTADGYVAIFPSAASSLTLTNHGDRPKVYGEFMSRLASLTLPVELAKLVKPVLDAWKKVQAADTGVITVAAEVKKARTAEKAARQAWLVGYDRLHSQIKDKFPRDKKRVARYFKGVSVAKAAEKDEDDTDGVVKPDPNEK